MRAPRFPIARILCAIVLCGVMFGALRSPSPMWANLLYSVVCVAIVLAAIQAVYTRGPARAFWAGFLIAGGSFFVVYSVPVLLESICPRLDSEPLIDLVYDSVARAPAKLAPPSTSVPNRMAAFESNLQGTSWQRSSVVAATGAQDSTSSRWALWTEPDYITGVGYPIGGILLVSSEAFRQVAYSILILAFAACGGLFARYRYGTATRGAAEQTPSATPCP